MAATVQTITHVISGEVEDGSITLIVGPPIELLHQATRCKIEIFRQSPTAEIPRIAITPLTTTGQTPGTGGSFIPSNYNLLIPLPSLSAGIPHPPYTAVFVLEGTPYEFIPTAEIALPDTQYAILVANSLPVSIIAQMTVEITPIGKE